MKIRLLLLLSLFAIMFNNASASDYPKGRIEKEIDDMGSLLDGEGLVFKPSKVKSNSTKEVIGNVNKYLYQASIDVLKFAPLISADSEMGLIITEWYSTREQRKTQFKVTVHIKDKVISPEAIEVVAFQRKKYQGKWQDSYESSPVAIVLEDKILRKARELYQNSKKTK